jgi:hypothetical protein
MILPSRRFGSLSVCSVDLKELVSGLLAQSEEACCLLSLRRSDYTDATVY